MRLWGVDNGKFVHALEGYMDELTALAFSPDGKTLALGSNDEKVYLWDIALDS